MASAKVLDTTSDRKGEAPELPLGWTIEAGLGGREDLYLYGPRFTGSMALIRDGRLRILTHAFHEPAALLAALGALVDEYARRCAS
jgi:hypothetical protein